MSDPGPLLTSGAEKDISSADTSMNVEAALPLSKKAQKKAAKAARFASQKLERRAREKEAKKEKKRLKRAAQEQDQDGEGEGEDAITRKRAKVLKSTGPTTKFGARLVVDLGFDDKMTDKVRPIAFEMLYEGFADLLIMHSFREYRKLCH
jgi:tRNA (guanine9-N1)-methyltransferase